MAELCMSCAHKKVCMKDKNLVGDVFIPGNPMFFDNKDLFKKYEERKKAGFPCDDYLSADVVPASDFRDCRNELCLKCGQYKTKHLGSCDGCRWEKI